MSGEQGKKEHRPELELGGPQLSPGVLTGPLSYKDEETMTKCKLAISDGNLVRKAQQ